MTQDNVLIFRIGSIGDTIVALPCFHLIARKFARMRRVLVTNISETEKAAPVESLLSDSGLIDDVIYFPSARRRVRDIWELRSKLSATKSKTLIYVAERNRIAILRDTLFFQTCGIGEIFGASPSRENLPRIDAETGEVEPEAERLVRCLAALGPIDLNDPAMWDLRLSASEVRVADAALAPLGSRPFIVVNLGGKVSSKDWGDHNWLGLFRLMSDDYQELALVFVGSRDEHERSSRISANWTGQSLNLCGRLSPRETAAAMKRARLFIGHDSGPMHLAAALGVRCVCMFGDFNKPRAWHPYGAQHQIVHNLDGVRAIQPSQIYAAVVSCTSTDERILDRSIDGRVRVVEGSPTRAQLLAEPSPDPNALSAAVRPSARPSAAG
jgi:ADP-heptose:LPS heptosyltransferase